MDPTLILMCVVFGTLLIGYCITLVLIARAGSRD